MTMTVRKIHAFSASGTVVVSLLVGLGVWWAGRGSAEAKEPDKDPFENYDVIDASLAEKAPDVVQPQKQFRQPDPVKPTLLSHDANAKPSTKPEEKPVDPKLNIDDVLAKHRDDDDDLEVGQPTTQPVIGRFDGSEDGFGDETKGDPYLGALKSDLLRSWEYPEILSDVGTPVGCIHLEPDGTIPETVLREKSGNDELDDSVERAMAELKKKRDADPKPVPAHLIPKTRKWICYRMRV
jgi:hypothetical protein